MLWTSKWGFYFINDGGISRRLFLVIPSPLQVYLPRMTHSGKTWFHHVGCNRRWKLLWHPLASLSGIAMPSPSFTFTTYLLTKCFAGEEWEPAWPSASFWSSAEVKEAFVATWISSSSEGLKDGEGKRLHGMP